ncbi:MAG: hypothetical protein CMJ24_02025 [Phycisphaerae bacterium]|nr:hypothetical protein [Phycisphaerae bacterium]
MATTRKTPSREGSKIAKTKKKATRDSASTSGSTKTVIPRTYSTVVRHLLERTNYERVRVVNYDEKTFKLDRMQKLLKRLGDPHLQVRTIHVAGTVGKGSTVAMLSNMIEGCDFTVGTFTSPHLIEVTERISINGEFISESAFTKLMREVIREAEKTDKNITYFELLTAAALKHFADEAIDIAIMEVGLGGRLDSTNVITPEVTVITRIELDHVRILGSTLESIAAEKAGIMKPGVPCFSVEQHPEVAAVLRQKAEEIGCELKLVGDDIEFSSRFCVSDDLGPHTRICLITDTNQYMHLPVPLPGEHQSGNCAVGLAAINHLKESESALVDTNIYRGLARTKVPGRMELVWKQPRIIVDGAHNPVSLTALMRGMGSHVPYDSMICIFGCCEDKDIDTMLDNLAIGGDKIIFTAAQDQARAADPEDLKQRFMAKRGKVCQTARNIGQALEIAASAASRDDLICVTGSFYLVGETKAHLDSLRKKRVKNRSS